MRDSWCVLGVCTNGPCGTPGHRTPHSGRTCRCPRRTDRRGSVVASRPSDTPAGRIWWLPRHGPGTRRPRARQRVIRSPNGPRGPGRKSRGAGRPGCVYRGVSVRTGAKMNDSGWVGCVYGAGFRSSERQLPVSAPWLDRRKPLTRQPVSANHHRLGTDGERFFRARTAPRRPIGPGTCPRPAAAFAEGVPHVHPFQGRYSAKIRRAPRASPRGSEQRQLPQRPQE